MRRAGLILTLTIGAGWIAACPGTLEDPGRFTPDVGVINDGGIQDCTAMALAILNDTSPTGCARLGCHFNTSKSGNLDLVSPDIANRLAITSTTATCNGLSVINTEQPRESLLYSKLTSAPPCGQRMPLGGTLTPAEVECIGVWLDSLAAPLDAGVTDTGTVADTGVADTGMPDNGVVDTGTPDTGPVDMGVPDMGPQPVDISFESESGTIEAPLETRSSTAAQGLVYTIVPLGPAINPDSGAAGVGRAQYNFTLDNDATVTIWLRAFAGDFAKDSVWVGVDGAFTRFNDINADNYGVWQWDEVHDSDNADTVVQYTLTAGQHSLELVRRETDLRLDAILITDDPARDPNN